MAETTPLHDVTAAAGASFVEQAGWLVPSHFGAPAAEYHRVREQAALFDISARGKIELTGPEALFFLNNLCTNDVKNLAPGAGCEAFLCTAKARVVSHVLMGHFQHPDKDYVLLDFVPGMADRVLKHLDHFLISEQVEFADRTHAIAMMHLCGPKTEEILASVAGSSLSDLAPYQHRAALLAEKHTCDIRRHDPLGVPGFDVLCASEIAPAIWKSLVDAGAAPAGETARDILRVEAGTPVYGRDIDDERFVMEIGRTQQAISFTKGCFLGQEPIVMARDRGHVNRFLVGLKVAGDAAVAPGAKVAKDQAEIGQVTSSVISPRLGILALAYLRRGSEMPGTRVRVEGREAEVAALPFAP